MQGSLRVKERFWEYDFVLHWILGVKPLQRERIDSTTILPEVFSRRIYKLGYSGRGPDICKLGIWRYPMSNSVCRYPVWILRNLAHQFYAYWKPMYSSRRFLRTGTRYWQTVFASCFWLPPEMVGSDQLIITWSVIFIFFRDTRDNQENDAKTRLSIPGPSPEDCSRSQSLRNFWQKSICSKKTNLSRIDWSYQDWPR